MPEYVVTKNAPDEILGKRVEAGQPITLTEQQAEHPLRRGHVVLPEPEAPSSVVEPLKTTKPVKPIDGARD